MVYYLHHHFVTYTFFTTSYTHTPGWTIYIVKYLRIIYHCKEVLKMFRRHFLADDIQGSVE